LEELESCRAGSHLGLDVGYLLGILLVEGVRHGHHEVRTMVVCGEEVKVSAPKIVFQVSDLGRMKTSAMK
jgi:hypothetical protein